MRTNSCIHSILNEFCSILQKWLSLFLFISIISQTGTPAQCGYLLCTADSTHARQTGHSISYAYYCKLLQMGMVRCSGAPAVRDGEVYWPSRAVGQWGEERMYFKLHNSMILLLASSLRFPIMAHFGKHQLLATWLIIETGNCHPFVNLYFCISSLNLTAYFIFF